MKRLLFVSPELPYPMQSGGKVKSMKLLHALSKRYRVTFASPLKGEDASHVDEFHAASPCVEHVHVPVDVPRSAINLLISYLQGIPLNVRRTMDSVLRNRIADVADDFDVIFLDHYEVYPYLPQGYGGLVVYHAHNAYFKIWERYASLPGNPVMRVASYLEAIRVRRCEASVARQADLVFAAPNDARELVDAGVSGNCIRPTFHLGDDSHLQRNELCFERTHKKLMYVGLLSWEPNVQGLLWFIEHVWPRLETCHPDLVFDVVGMNPDPRLVDAAAAHAGITLTGFVADLEDIYRDSRVSVAPLLFGSGMKVKVLDAMARGIPTVTTPVGAEGIDIRNGVHLMVSEAPDHMASQIDQLLSDAVLWDTLRTQSRQLIGERYTWASLFESMHRDMDHALSLKRDAVSLDNEVANVV
ncbi:glycosyl transferase [Halioglobus sp. HI00S01]|uniref:glycosyltransferase n=1 Tax=Halioglobus sp. HI00S01 TaxID=1822214 RepID=UPI0007C2A629|nr:glycosyltransferase [Halioglobus sp. HI00S01]KZX55117.1 glycosyl transferase [Halioglobus sp. HI00S01]